MESKHKNALIGALLAVVFVMAVGYAAFAQQLTINGNASITSTWDVRFSNVAADKIVTPSSGFSGNNPEGTITLSDSDHVATLSANLKQFGDSVTFVVKPTNYGTIKAQAASAAVITAGDGETGLTIAQGGQSATKGNIKWEIISADSATTRNVLETNDQDTITVKATFMDLRTTENTDATVALQTAKIKIVLNYEQVA